MVPAPQAGVPPDQGPRRPEGGDASNPDPSSVYPVPICDAQLETSGGREAALEEGILGPVVGPSTSVGDRHERPNIIGASASQSDVLHGHSVHTVPSADAAASISVSTLGPSFVNKFAGLRVNTTYSFLASQRATAQDRTPLSSPLSSPPSSPSFPSSTFSFDTPVRERPGDSSHAVDFSLYTKKTRTLTKSPRKSPTKASGKLPAHEPTSDVTKTTWFYKTSTEPHLLATPPDLTGHPEGLALGDVYFDCVDDQYQLWLWCLDNVRVPHWKKIPFGYEREDGKRLIVTRKIHFLSWVTTKYYKELINEESLSTRMDVDED